MIKQNILLLYPSINELQQAIILHLYNDPKLLQFHSYVQQIKSKFPIPPYDPQPYPTQDDVLDYFQKSYRPVVLDLSALLNNPQAKIKLYKNAVYFGFLENGLRQGLGILIKDNSQLYEGTFHKDKKDGIGFEALKNNSFYYGHYNAGLPHGEGVFQAKHQTYIGQWQNGKKHGIGYCATDAQDYFLSQWEIGKLNGLCLHISKDIYFGATVNDLKHGHGKEYFENGDQFHGDYSNGKPNGQGDYIWNNGNSYKGEFQNGLRNGIGVWIGKANRSVNKYHGEYVNDKKCGKGIFQYANGTQYEGYFQDDKRAGYGEMTWPDNATYRGYWSNNLMDGEGIYEFQNIVLKGQWRDNQLQTYDRVRMGLENFPVTNRLKEIREDEEVMSKMADEPDLGDEIGDQFRNELMAKHTKLQSEQSKSRDEQKLPILRQQFDLLSVLERNLHVDQNKREISSSVGIQTESKKRFLPKLQQITERKNYSVDYGSSKNTDQFRFDSISNSPKLKTRETDKSKHQKQSNKSVQLRGSRKKREVLLSKKEINIWSIKMAKLKLSPKKYTKLWNHSVVSEIRQIIHPPVWKPPSHLI